MCDLFIFAGEHSGDLHGNLLLKALHETSPDLKIGGVGGPRMRKNNFSCFIPMEEFQVMGFIDVVKSFPKLLKLFRKVKKCIIEKNPKTILFIDYPGFNLRMARSLRKVPSLKNTKFVHYISPSVWAWGKKRIPLMEKNLDHLVTIFPFETKYFPNLNTEFLGNPTKNEIESFIKDPTWQEKYHLDANKPILAIYPGSRMKEVQRNLPLQLECAKKIPGYQVVISLADKKLIPFLPQNEILINPEDSHNLMSDANLAIATSGTVTLELALFHVPTVVTYAVTKLDLFLARKIFKIILPHYALVNIIGQKEVVKELFGPNFTKEKLLDSLQHTLKNKDESKKKLEAISELLGNQKAAPLLAEKITWIIKDSKR